MRRTRWWSPRSERASASARWRRSPATSLCSRRTSGSRRSRCRGSPERCALHTTGARGSRPQRLTSTPPIRASEDAVAPRCSTGTGWRNACSTLTRSLSRESGSFACPEFAMRPSLKGLRKRAAASAEKAAAGSPVPAGQDAPTAQQLQRPGARERGAMRRRLRKLRHERDALVADLGGLVVELHRHGRTQSPLIGQRVQQIAAIDAEMHGLAQALGSELTLGQVVVAGIAGTCTNCGALLATSDRFCSVCGTAVSPAIAGQTARAPPPPPATPATGPKPPPPATARPLASKPPPPANARPLGTSAPPPTADGGEAARTRAAS